jgi:hypothetical protein
LKRVIFNLTVARLLCCSRIVRESRIFQFLIEAKILPLCTKELFIDVTVGSSYLLPILAGVCYNVVGVYVWFSRVDSNLAHDNSGNCTVKVY